MSAFFWIFILIVGFYLLWKGGDWFIEGVSGLAKRFGVPEFLLGVSVVAFGTSLPELIVNLMALYEGESGVVFGNVIGSNIANILLIFGTVSFVAPVVFKPLFLKRHIPLVLSVSAALIGLVLWDGGMGLTRIEGGLLLVGFFGFLVWLLRHPGEVSTEEIPAGVTGNLWRIIGISGLGLVGLLLGGRLVVDSVQELGVMLGISKEILALVLVAIGTSLPELVASLQGMRRGLSSLVIGNVLGSNLFNILLVVGACGSLRELAFPEILIRDLWVMVGSLGLLLGVLILPSRLQITRVKGAFLVGAYFLYLGWIFLI